MAQITKTPAMVLQELTVKRGYSPPEYVLVYSRNGTHANEFHYNVSVAGVNGLGFGRSKQVAKHNAASKALELLAEQNLYDPSSGPAHEFNAQAHRNETDSPEKAPINCIGSLQERCAQFKLNMPCFSEVSDVGPPHCRQFTYICSLASITTQATANTKKQAKQLAARDMLDKVEAMYPELLEQCLVEHTLLDKDQIVEVYDTLSPFHVAPNRSIKIANLALTVKELMRTKKLSFADFKEDFERMDLDNLCSKVGIEYEMKMFQESPPIAVITFGLEMPITIMEVGVDENNAKSNVCIAAFNTLRDFME